MLIILLISDRAPFRQEELLRYVQTGDPRTARTEQSNLAGLLAVWLVDTQGRTVVLRNRIAEKVTCAVVLDGYSGGDAGRAGLQLVKRHVSQSTRISGKLT
jgi:hypothetical protein